MARNKRSGEHGQTLVLAIAFLAFFGLIAAAVLTFASSTERQRGSTELTATNDSVADGAAQFALADTGVEGCGIAGGGTMKFPAGDVVSYQAPGGSCSSSTSTASGQNCGLCVLNFEGVTTPLSVLKGSWLVPGEIDVNGSVSVVSICSGPAPCPPAKGRIGLHGSGAKCKTTCSPAPVALSSPVIDPLANALPIPTPTASPPSASGNKIICPGTYKDLGATGSGQILFLSPYGKNGCAASSAPSLYIVTGSISIQGGGSLVASASTLYLTQAASFSTAGNGDFSIDCGATAVLSTCGATADTPAAGRYAGVAIFVNPANASTISLQGNGNYTVAGTFEASHATITMGGNGGSQSFQSGRLIVSQLTGNGNGGAGLGFSGNLANSTGCNYWNDTLSGTPASGMAQPAHVRFESACNSDGPSSIINFAYGP
jgi:hypothetical protein